MTSSFRIISPADGTLYFEGAYAADTVAAAAIDAARAAYDRWRRRSIEDRFSQIDRFVREIERRAPMLAEMTAWQMGRPVAKADETGGLRQMTDFYAGTLERYGQPVPLPESDGARRILKRLPIGINLSICAWNFPVAMTAGLIVAPLLLGNVVIFKHAPQTARITDVLNEAALSADLPLGVFQGLHLTHEQCERMLRSGRVDLVNFIGSTRGGLQIRNAASTGFVHQILELGGKDPAYVRADADLDLAVPALAAATFGNSGQSCCSVERIYVDAARHDEFVERFVATTQAMTVGHPVNDDADLGPVVTAQAARRIRADVDDAVRSGATEIVGADQSAGDVRDDAYLAPRVLINVTNAMRVMRDETFGPVAPIMKTRSDDEAISLMNDCAYGLTASVWTADHERGLALGERVDTGNFYVNRADYVDELLPWGGVKQSGLGNADGLFWGDDLTRLGGYYVRPA